jgi:hypothetical protein
MRKVLIVVLLLVVSVGGLGLYLGWFGFSTSRDPETGRGGVQLKIDQEKMKSDVQKAKEKITGGTNQAKEQSSGQ